ncbi:ADP-ribosylglycohydrolase family protein [Sorangium sp. So ce1014]|uniref:ADP-ribosylglycohydrolase family protein n=1 Tax=Sorangium sp. So ce1014 TaxID=3133326 RepID=UPI003F63679F
MVLTSTLTRLPSPRPRPGPLRAGGDRTSRCYPRAAQPRSPRQRGHSLAEGRAPRRDRAYRFGCSGDAVEAVPIALFVAATTAREPLESVIATAVSLGGDTDTIAAIAAQVAATSGRPVPEGLIARLPEAPQLAPVLDPFISLLQ